jgi:hypothetical protein
MKTHVTGNAAVDAAAPTQEAAHTAAVTAYRQTLLGLILHNPLFTDAEQLRANHNAHACECPLTLAKWVRNTTKEADRRRANPPATYATASQRETIVRLLNHPKVSRQQKIGTLLGINRLTKEAAAELITKLELLTGAKAPGQQLTLPTLTRYAPRPTSRADQQAAARFVPTSTLTVADFPAALTVAPAQVPAHLSAYATGAAGLRPALAGEFVCLTLHNN